MRHFRFLPSTTHPSLSLQRAHIHFLAPITLLCLIALLVTACGSPGSSSTTQSSTPTNQAKVVVTLSPTATPIPSPQPTKKPTTVPTAQPTPAQQGAPAILDLRPSSMSLVGHLDCQQKGAYICYARVLSRADAQSDLQWTASTNVPGGVSFNPVSGIVKPGQSVLITITVPLNACTPGLFYFQGPVNTHTITWAC
ncbi:MAG TPA: hypothetical protein VFN23_19260 [Ktedonobacteraceae bacterium]|nr:hypothetical protein [Ktedonobacteraceae bacterium]